MRTQKPIKEGSVREGMVGWGILARLRGSERAKVGEVRREIEGMLGKVQSVAETRTVLEAALFRLGKGKEEERVVIGKECADEPETETETEAEPKDKKDLDLSKLEIVFDKALGKEKKKDKKVCRYQLNPRPNWGPMNRAGGVNPQTKIKYPG